jgi:transposase
MSIYAKVRRMRLREGLSVSEISRRTSISRNTIKTWLAEPVPPERRYQRPSGSSLIDAYADWLRQAIRADALRPRKERRTALRLYGQLQQQGFAGSYSRVTAFLRRSRAEVDAATARTAFVPLTFVAGEAFQFDWSDESILIGGLHRKIQLAHMKLCASRAFWMVRLAPLGTDIESVTS